MSRKDKLGGIVEVDETWVGGKDKNRHWDKHSGTAAAHGSGKTPVIGAVSRKGNVVARVLSRVTSEAAQAFVREVVLHKVSLLATDESRVYDGLTEYPHKAVYHAARNYVVGAVHTNTIEGFWSIFKRGIVGSFHKVSENICRCTSRSSSSATTIGRTRTFSERQLRDAEALKKARFHPFSHFWVRFRGCWVMCVSRLTPSPKHERGAKAEEEEKNRSAHLIFPSPTAQKSPGKEGRKGGGQGF